MSDSLLTDPSLGKGEKYEALIPQLKALTEGEPSLVANLANISAALKETFGWWWIGFYLVQDDQLVLGPFQGPIACTRIAYGKGVCGSAWKEKRSLLVPDVDAFPGHIACSSASRSELVVPVFRGNEVVAVMDADSEHLAHFDATDTLYMEQIAALAQKCFLSAQP